MHYPPFYDRLAFQLTHNFIFLVFAKVLCEMFQCLSKPCPYLSPSHLIPVSVRLDLIVPISPIFRWHHPVSVSVPVVLVYFLLFASRLCLLLKLMLAVLPCLFDLMCLVVY